MSSKNLSILISLSLFFLAVSIIFNHFNSVQKKSPKQPSVFPPIDTTITKSTDPQYSYMNTNINFNTYFPDDFINTDSNIKFQKNNSSVTFNLLSSAKNKIPGQNDKNQIFYPKIFQDGDKFIDLRYTVHPDKLSEELILNQKQNLPKFSQKLNLFNAYIIQTPNQINFYHPSTDELLWFIPSPVMYEQNNLQNQHSGLNYHLQCDTPNTSTKDCRSFIFTKEITSEGQKWLNDPNRNYPVIIDPNFQINNADVATQWVSSNPSVLTVSSETSLKVEGTASVKIVGTTNPANCWGIGNECDSSCNNTGIGSSTAVYTSCTRGSLCSNTNCWTYSGSCNSCCDDNSYSTVWVCETHEDCILEANCYNRFTMSGTCVNGSGFCYCKSAAIASIRYRPATSCNSLTVYGAHPSCTWATAKYPYTASGTTLRYAGNGTACNSGGTGTCYKFTPDGTNTYTGNNACGSGATTCAGASIRNTYTACTYYSGVYHNVGTQITAADLSQTNSISFWVRANTTGSFIRFQIGETGSNEQTYNITINSANTWEQKTWNISGISDSLLDSIKYMAFRVTDLSKTFTFYFDDIQTDIDNPNSPSNCRINQGLDNSSLQLLWTDNATSEEGFKLYKSTDSSAFTLYDTIDADSSSYLDSDVHPGSSYAYKIFTFDTILGNQITSPACDFPVLNLGEGNFNMEGIKLEGIKIN